MPSTIFVNSVIEFATDGESRRLERVLWIDQERFDLVSTSCDRRELPRLRRVSELQELLTTGTATVLETDPHEWLYTPEELLSPSRKRDRDAAWTLIEPLTKAEFPRIAIDERYRGRMVADLVSRTGSTKKVVYNTLKTYFSGGRTRNALLPQFQNCGGRGKERTRTATSEPKRGRPDVVATTTGRVRGVNVTPQIEEIFRHAIRKFYLKLGLSFPQTHKAMVEVSFTRTIELPDPRDPTKVSRVKVASDDVPTLRQFRYWYSKHRDPEKEITSREGRINYYLKHRPVLGISTTQAFGPGSVYEIDATVADVYLVSSLDRGAIIGRPVLYFVEDLFSRMITGFAVTLEGPSRLGAMLALDNAFSAKAAFCADYGVEISDSTWPCAQIPEALHADRGELLSKNSDNLARTLDINVINLPPRRADWKGVIEQNFRLINIKFKKWVPGTVYDLSGREGPDYRLDARLTLREFRRVIIECILEHNASQHIGRYPVYEDMAADHVPKRPIHLWNWGMQNRTGALRAVPGEFLRANLLYQDIASVTPEGILFSGLLYYCETAARDKWFLRAKKKHWKLPIAYDPRWAGSIYARHADGRVETCHLLPHQAAFMTREWYEAADYVARALYARRIDEPEVLRIQAEHHERRIQLIEEASQKTQAHLSKVGPLSDSERVRGIRENRKIEKAVERIEGAWTLDADRPCLPEYVAVEDISPEDRAGVAQEREDLNLIRQLQQEIWNETKD